MRGGKRNGTLILVVILALGIALAWRHYAAFRWDLFAATFGFLHHEWLIAGVLLALASYLGRAWRWKVMMLPAPSRIWSLFSATLIGFSATVILGRAGELVRPYLIAKKENSTLPAQGAIWLLERLYDLLCILAFFGVGLSQLRTAQLPASSRFVPLLHIGGWLVGALAVLAVGILYMLGNKPELCRRRVTGGLSFLPESMQAKLCCGLDSFLEGAQSTGRTGSLAASIALTLFEWSLILASLWCYFHAYPPTQTFTLLDVAVFLGFVSLGNIIQLPGIGGGAQLAAIVVLT